MWNNLLKNLISYFKTNFSISSKFIRYQKIKENWVRLAFPIFKTKNLKYPFPSIKHQQKGGINQKLKWYSI